MDRRSFLVMSLAGAADPMQALQPAALQKSASVSSRALNSDCPSAIVPGFDDWLSGFRARLILDGYPADLIDQELTGLTADPRVVAAESRQPEFSKPMSDYVKGVVTEGRVREGQGFMSSLAFMPDVEQRFGVPREIMLAIWCVESGFGRIQGDMDVLRCLATIAASGRRRAFGESQIKAALQMIVTGEATRSTLRGSWAGAMGQTQFIPTSFLTAAVDQDGDGRRDIWSSHADALASCASLLRRGGWQGGVGWQREVILPPDFDYSLAEGPRNPPAWWEAMGVKLADGRGWSQADAAASSALIVPCGLGGPAFLVLPNHFAIRTYNNATAYALAVGLLADRFAAHSAVMAAWPAESPLSLADRTGAQEALRKLGFDPGDSDGIVGVQTRVALRAWQKARGKPADGYLSIDVVRALMGEISPT